VSGVAVRLPGKFAPWGRWEVNADGRVCMAWRCACNVGAVHTQYVTLDENGSSVEMRCPTCRQMLCQIRVSKEICANGGKPGSGR